MDLQGTLDKMSLPDLLQMLTNGEQEGTLLIKRGNDERRLHISNAGQVVVHAGTPEHSLLGKRLYEAGLILEQEFLNALRKQSLKAQPLGEILRSYKAVSGEKVDQVVRLLVMDKLVELFGWQTGEFKFQDGMEETASPYTEVALDSSYLIMEAARQYDELKRIQDFDWSHTHVFIASGEKGGDFEDDELAERVLSCLDGIRNVEGGATHCGASIADTINALWRLTAAGAVRLATPDELYEKAEECRRNHQLLKSRWLLREAVRLKPSAKYLRKLAEYSLQDEAQEEAADVYVKLARSLVESDPVGSVESLEKAIEIDEKNSDAHEMLCRLYVSANNFPGAIKEAESIEKTCLNRERALACYELLAEKKPGDLSVRLPRARLLAATHRFEESYEECKRLERVLPTPRQIELLPIYEHIVRAGTRQEEITTRIRRLHKLAAATREPERKPPAQRVATAVVVALFLVFALYQVASQLRFSAAKRQVEKMRVGEQYQQAADLLAHMANTTPFTLVRAAAEDLAEEYRQQAQQKAATLAFEAAVSDAQALAEKGDFDAAKRRIEAYMTSFPYHKAAHAKSIIEKLEGAKAEELVAAAQRLRSQALEFEQAGQASKAIEIYEQLAGDQELMPFAGSSVERAKGLRRQLEEARNELAAAQQLEKGGNYKDAHLAISGILAKYPATRNDIPIRLPFLLDSMPPGAEVRVDGNPVGNTPQVIHYLPEFPRRISVAKPGFSPVEFDLSGPREWSKVVSLSKRPMWTFKAGGPLDTAPCFRDGVLFFGSRDTHVYAVSAQSGGLLWKEKGGPLSEVTSTPAATATVVVAGTLDGTVIAFEPSSGQPKWKFGTGGFVRSAPEIDEAAERGCVASADGLIYGFSTASGNVTWKTDAGAPISADAARQAKLAIYVTEKGKVLAVDIVTGDLLWSEETGAKAVGIALADNTAVVASSSGEVIGLNIKSGEIIWRKVARGKLDSPPVASSGQVLVATHLGEVAVFQAGTGTETRRIELPEEAPAHLALDGNLLLAATATGAVFAIDVSTGELIWPAATSGAIDSAPLITGQGVFVVSRDHNIYAYPRSE